MHLRIGIAGATGAVGRILCDSLSTSRLECSEIRLLASQRSVGQKISVGNQEIEVQLLSRDSLENLDLCIASTPDDVALEIADWCRELGVTLIDESAAHRMLDDVPLIVPEVNADAARNHNGLLASPNCSTTQMVVCLKPLHDFAKVKRVVVSTYQAANGAGLAGEEDLIEGSKSAIRDHEWNYKAFSKPLAFNVLPKIGSAKPNGYTSEEMKMALETRKILGDSSIDICATCVRVPVVCGHSESIVVECERPIDDVQARKLFEEFNGIEVVDELADDLYPTPLENSGNSKVFVGRIRNSLSTKNAIAFWCVSDNLRKGAATNALQIAELLVDQQSLLPMKSS